MNLTRQITALQNESRDFTLGERAELACRLARRLEKAGEYETAAEALSEFWAGRTESPELEGLDNSTKAAVLLRVGALEGYLGSADQSEGSQEAAKNLITASIEISETLAQTGELAEARGELALCYWREGSYDEARIQLAEALSRANDQDSELKAVLLIRAAIVEVDTQQFHRALQLYNEAFPLIENAGDHALKGSFHNGYGLLLRRLATPENRENYLDRALIEYSAASFHYEQAANLRAVARVEGNLGFLHFTIGRYQDAHHHLDRARDLFLQLKDVGTAAQVDETRARTLLAEGRLREAERTIRAAVKVLEKGGQQAILAEALTTQGTIAARMGNDARARLLFERGIVIAETVGDREGSGRARLTIVEELGNRTPLKQLAEIYESAAELLEQSQDPATNKRLISCGRKIIDALLAEERREAPLREVGSWEGFSLRKELAKLERILIERALRDAGGSVTKASKLLGFRHHQSLIGVINTRHRDILPQRSLVRKRRRHLFSEPKRSKKKSAQPEAKPNQLSILHVEDHKVVSRLVKDILGANRFHIQSCADGLAALEILKSATPVDVLIVDNNLPGLSGLELVLRVRSIVHRRNLPIVMLSGDDVDEREAWRAGVDAFLRKTEAGTQLAGTIQRLLKEKDEDG